MTIASANPAQFIWRVLAPAIGVLAITLVIAAWALVAIGGHYDRDAIDRSEKLIQTSWNHHIDDLKLLLKDHSSWGDAYSNLHVSNNTEWAYGSDNIGPSLFTNFNIDYVAVIGPDGKTKYFVDDGQMVSPKEFRAFFNEIADVVKQVQAGADDEPIAKVVRIAGAPTIFAASRLTTGSDPKVPEIPGPPSVLVFGEAMQVENLGRLANEVLVKGLRTAGDEADAQRSPRLSLANTAQSSGMTLRWIADEPGSAMLRSFTPWIALIGSWIFAIVCLIVGFARSAKSSIDAGAKRLEAAFHDAQFRAFHDVATGLPNRALLMQELRRALSQPHDTLALIYVDLDNFKLINDTLGHPVGDVVLSVAAERLKATVEHDDLVSRVGGDEFVILARRATLEQVETLCRDLIVTVSEPIEHLSHKLHVGLSIGVALATRDAIEPEELVRLADIALYQAKAGGRRTHRLYAPEMNDLMHRRAGLVHELARALGRDELELEYEPVYDTRTMQPVRLDARLRWIHPERGVIESLDFLPLAEQTGMIEPIMAWAVAEACSAVARWPAVDVTIGVAVERLGPGRLAALTASALRKSGLDPQRLEIRITDAAALSEGPLRVALSETRQLGVKLALEGHDQCCPALSAFKSFRFDAIHLGPGLISVLTATGLERTIMRVLIGLAQTVGADVSAAGVTSSSQLLLLQFDQCARVQGTLLSAAGTALELAERMGFEEMDDDRLTISHMA